MKFQSGQSTMLMLVLSLVLMLTMVFVFNTSQLLSERQQAKMLADQAAYATATRQARLLNINAYINRTQIANQLAIAQAVSTGSWFKYAAKTSDNISTLTTYFPPVSAVFANVATGLDYAADGIGQAYIRYYGIEVKALEVLQNVLNLSSNVAVFSAPQEFSDLASGKNKSEYDVILIASESVLPIKIMKQYTDKERERMAEVVRISAKKDGFISNRSKNDVVPKIYVPTPGLIGTMRIHKAGGTELVGLDEWKGVDTLSIHLKYKKLSKLKWKTHNEETPIGWGSGAGSALGTDEAKNSGSYGGASSVNPQARKYAENNVPNYWDPRSSSSSITGVGIPNFYELSDLKDTDTVFPLVISAQKSKNKIKTVNRNSNLKISKDFTVLDNYDELEKGMLSNGNMHALTKAEVYFQRPWEMEVTVSSNTINHEYGSLFSPYWQIRLSDDIDVSKRALIATEAALRH